MPTLIFFKHFLLTLIYILLHIKKHYFIHFCCLSLKSSKTLSVSLTILGVNIENVSNTFTQPLLDYPVQVKNVKQIKVYLVIICMNLIKLLWQSFFAKRKKVSSQMFKWALNMPLIKRKKYLLLSLCLMFSFCPSIKGAYIKYVGGGPERFKNFLKIFLSPGD